MGCARPPPKPRPPTPQNQPSKETAMKFKRLPPPAALAAVVCSACAANFTLRMGGGHPTGLTYVGVYDTYFATEVTKRVKETTGHDIRFIKAWGGSVAKVDG